MSLSTLHTRMAWPNRESILSPPGVGPRVLAESARQKIQETIRVSPAGDGHVRVGLLTSNPYSDRTEAPIAIVCEFPRIVSQATLAECHRLAWNFVRSPLLVTVEPHLVRAWTCCEPPASELDLLGGAGEIAEARLDLRSALSPSDQAAHALHWVRLASGDFYRRFPDRFPRDGRADRVLLDELTRVRKRLKQQTLDDDTIHDLLARVIFCQFLFDRKDADGRPALNAGVLSQLRDEGHLTQDHSGLGSILGDHEEAYRFFRWLNDKFNGDLFPGKGETPDQREAEWRQEMEKVQPKHLETLADFVGGRLRGRQRVLWRQYALDVIPLEFISSVYEEFVTGKGAHYTPGYLVDFMLDEVLPWNGDQWDLKILDPACGSGIFLVKAYQRLIQRWKNVHPDQRPTTALLRKMLERNLFGVDIDPHAVRVASFSLYLTMCDEIDPKTYLKSTKFPRLRGQQLTQADFFREDVSGFSTEKDGPSYDLVVGNAPWGQDTETEPASEWARHPSHPWPIPNNAVGTLFLAKAASLTKTDGRVSMIQPASSLLFNRSGPARRFREKLFSEFKVEEVVNLSTLRFELFENATSPPCIVTLRPVAPDGEPLVYVSPKQAKEAGSGEKAASRYTIIVEPHDVSRIWPDEAISEPHVWTSLAWGGRRDLAFIQRLSAADSLQRLALGKRVVSREGIIRGPLELDEIVGRHILEAEDFPEGTLLRLSVERLPVNEDPHVHRRTELNAFDLPQLIIKQGWTAGAGRFRAVVAEGPQKKGAICSQSYVSVHADDDLAEWLNSAAVSYNSSLAVYFLLLTSGRMASYRPEPLVEEIRNVPVAIPKGRMLDGLRSVEDIDRRIRKAFSIKDAEWALVEDLYRYTLPDFKGDETSPGRQPTERAFGSKSFTRAEPDLSVYCDYFIRVLKAGFGQDKGVCATIFQDAAESALPVRLVAIHLDWHREEPISVEPIESAALCNRLTELDEKLLQTGDPKSGGIYFQRVVRVYDEYRHRRRSIPSVYIVKPDRVRYWTRSAALRDADEVAADVQAWQQQSGSGRGPK